MTDKEIIDQLIKEYLSIVSAYDQVALVKPELLYMPQHGPQHLKDSLQLVQGKNDLETVLKRYNRSVTQLNKRLHSANKPRSSHVAFIDIVSLRKHYDGTNRYNLSNNSYVDTVISAIQKHIPAPKLKAFDNLVEQARIGEYMQQRVPNGTLKDFDLLITNAEEWRKHTIREKHKASKA